MLTKKQAFTLVEMAVVLVIIGVVIGSVVVVKNLRAVALRQAQASQLQELNSAVASFSQQYYGLPGDHPNGVALGVQTVDGDGNNLIGVDGSSFGATEGEQAARALKTAGLIDAGASGIGEPIDAAIGRSFIIPRAISYWGSALSSVGNGRNAWVVAVAEDGTTNDSLTGKDAYQLDVLLDDGSPFTGRVIVFATDAAADREWDTNGDLEGYFDGSNAQSTACVTGGTFPDDTATYSKAGTTTVCPLFVDMQAP